jgi:hypothetical protein
VGRSGEGRLPPVVHRNFALSPRSLLYIQVIASLLVSMHVLRWLASSSWEWGGDMEAYWGAAVRLREGQTLFPALTDLNAQNVYRYSAWFAVAWVPLTFLPKELVTVVWVGLMMLSGWVLVRTAAKSGTLAGYLLAAILAPVLFQSAFFGQVQSLLALALMWGLARPIGPVVIGIAASLKLTPILLLLVYLPDRELRKAATALAVAVVLAAPTLGFDLTHYPFHGGDTISLWSKSPLLWGSFGVAVVTGAVFASLRWPRFASLAGGAAAALVSPRVYVDYATYLLPALTWRRDR